MEPNDEHMEAPNLGAWGPWIPPVYFSTYAIMYAPPLHRGGPPACGATTPPTAAVSLSPPPPTPRQPATYGTAVSCCGDDYFAATSVQIMLRNETLSACCARWSLTKALSARRARFSPPTIYAAHVERTPHPTEDCLMVIRTPCAAQSCAAYLP